MPTQLGDASSLKAETSDLSPSDDEMPSKSDEEKGTGKAEKEKPKLKDMNPRMLGDPASLRAETSDNEPTEHDRGALGTSKQSGKPKM